MVGETTILRKIDEIAKGRDGNGLNLKQLSAVAGIVAAIFGIAGPVLANIFVPLVVARSVEASDKKMREFWAEAAPLLIAQSSEAAETRTRLLISEHAAHPHAGSATRESSVRIEEQLREMKSELKAAIDKLDRKIDAIQTSR